MNKTIQAIILTFVISIGIGARLSILGWLFIIGFGSAIIFGISHILIHSRCMNFFATGGRWTILKFILSHLFFLGIFLFQFDFDDSKTYSVLNYTFGIKNSFLEENGFYIVGISIIGYIWISVLNIRQAKKLKSKTNNSKYIIPVLISSIILPLFLINGLYMFNDFKEEKKIEETGQFLSVKRALKNPEKVISINLTSTFPKLTRFPIEILDLPNLEIINLNEQNISVIPDEIQKAQKLEILNLLDNNIKEIPESICKCENLKELRIGGEIKEFPECLKKMKSLKHLSIQSNTVNELMDELREFENIETAHFYLKEGILDRKKLSQIENETGIKHKY